MDMMAINTRMPPDTRDGLSQAPVSLAERVGRMGPADASAGVLSDAADPPPPGEPPEADEPTPPCGPPEGGDPCPHPLEAAVKEWARRNFIETLMFGDEEETGVPALSIDI